MPDTLCYRASPIADNGNIWCSSNSNMITPQSPERMPDAKDTKIHLFVSFASGAGAFLFLFLSLISATAQSIAQPSSLRLSEYQKQNWQVEDGLIDNNIRMIAQQPDGVLLLASASGLATFDGQHFQSVPVEAGGLTDNEAVSAIVLGHNDDLWIGTDGRGVLHRTPTGTANIS